MNTEKMKSILEGLPDLLEFRYNGRYGNIDHYYILETKSEEYLLYFEGEKTTEILVDSLDKAMETPFIEGKNLYEVAELLEIL